MLMCSHTLSILAVASMILSRKVAWMRCQEPDPFQPFDLAQSRHEESQVRPVRQQIAPIAIDDLAEQRDLASAFEGDKPLCLADNLPHRTAHLAPSPERHNAVCASPVAASHHRYPASDSRLIAGYNLLAQPCRL